MHSDNSIHLITAAKTTTRTYSRESYRRPARTRPRRSENHLQIRRRPRTGLPFLALRTNRPQRRDPAPARPQPDARNPDASPAARQRRLPASTPRPRITPQPRTRRREPAATSSARSRPRPAPRYPAPNTSQSGNNRPLLNPPPTTSIDTSTTPSTTRNTSSGKGIEERLKITIESLNARYRRAIKARGHFPSEQAALKCLYLVTRSLDPTGVGRARWTMRWKPALNAFAITFGDRFPAAETY
jgi:hypothetical protein